MDGGTLPDRIVQSAIHHDRRVAFAQRQHLKGLGRRGEHQRKGECRPEMARLTCPLEGTRGASHRAPEFQKLQLLSLRLLTPRSMTAGVGGSMSLRARTTHHEKRDVSTVTSRGHLTATQFTVTKIGFE